MFKKFIKFIKNLFKKKHKKIKFKNPIKIKSSKPNQYELKYQKMFNDFEYNQKINSSLENYISDINFYKKRYQFVEKETGCPWEVVACIHLLEGGLSFKNVLHNGESLYRVNKYGTKLVPKGRGKGKNWTWEDAAVDALLMEKRKFPLIWSSGSSLDFLEKYNGIGYRKYHKDINTPYLWSYTNYYTKGKYVSDGKYDKNAVSKQIGAAIILRELNYLSIRI